MFSLRNIVRTVAAGTQHIVAASASNPVNSPELVLSYNCGCPFKKRKKIEGKLESLEPGQGHWNNFLFKKIIVPLC